MHRPPPGRRVMPGQDFGRLPGGHGSHYLVMLHHLHHVDAIFHHRVLIRLTSDDHSGSPGLAASSRRYIRNSLRRRACDWFNSVPCYFLEMTGKGTMASTTTSKVGSHIQLNRRQARFSVSIDIAVRQLLPPPSLAGLPAGLAWRTPARVGTETQSTTGASGSSLPSRPAAGKCRTRCRVTACTPSITPPTKLACLNALSICWHTFSHSCAPTLA